MPAVWSGGQLGGDFGDVAALEAGDGELDLAPARF